MRNPFNRIFRINDPNAVDAHGYTRLHNAIFNKDLKKVNALIAAGAHLNNQDTTALTSTPLHLALTLDCQMIALALIKAGADVNLQDARGQTPLHAAVIEGQEAFILTLLKLDADPNVQDRNGRTPLHVVPKSSPQIIDILARHHAKMNERDKNGDTPLHLFLDQAEAAERLLGNGADPNILNDSKVSPYMALLALLDDRHLRRYTQTLQAMIFFKANIKAVNPQGETILHIAARLEMEEVFSSVVDRADLAAVDSNGNNVLHALARTQNIPMLARVLELAPQLVQEANHAGFSPLDELVKCVDGSGCQFGFKYIEAARMLLTHKANPDSTDRKGRSLLHHAVTHDRIDFLDELLVLGANPDLVDQGGKTALHNAIERHNLRAMDILLDRGANPDMTDQRGWTILDRLAEKGDRDSPMVQRLVVAGGQYQKQLPLHPETMRRQKPLDKSKPSGGHTLPPPRL